MNFKNQEELKNHVERLKAFYNEFYTFLIVMAVSLLAWLLSRGYFWPLWIMVLWGGPLFFKASKLEIVDSSYYKLICSLREQLPFLRKSWEKEKLDELKSNLQGSEKPAAAKKAADPKKIAAKKAAVKKPAVKKVAAKKPAAKKATPKKAAAKKTTTKKK